MLYIDITEFIGNPIRTGIQRIVREVLTHWPASIAHRLVCFDGAEDRLRTVHHDAVEHAIALARHDEFDLSDARAQIDFLDRPTHRRPVDLMPGDRLLAPELFFEHRRVAFYRRTIKSGTPTFLIVPDFLVWLRPDTFPIASASPLMPYLQLLLECPGRAFISKAVQQTFESRILKGPVQPGTIALDLGADGLQIEKQRFDPGKKTLICVGTLDGRKAQEHVYEAFCNRSGLDEFRLVFLGRVPDRVSSRLSSLLSNTRPDVDLITDASDAVVRDFLRIARASVYVSPAEGYGLPPMESLYAGVPVLVHHSLPALQGKPETGQIRLSEANPDMIRTAIEQIGDDRVAARLWGEAASFPGVTWKDVAREVAIWADDAAHGAGAVADLVA